MTGQSSQGRNKKGLFSYALRNILHRRDNNHEQTCLMPSKRGSFAVLFNTLRALIIIETISTEDNNTIDEIKRSLQFPLKDFKQFRTDSHK